MAQDKPHGEQGSGPGPGQPAGTDELSRAPEGSGSAEPSEPAASAGPNPWARPGSSAAEQPPEARTSGQPTVEGHPAGEQQTAPYPGAQYPGVPYPGNQYPGAPYGGQYGQQPTTQYPAGAYGPPGAPPYPGGYPAPGGAGPPHRPTRRNMVLGLVALGAVLALVAGGIGGAIGADLARSGGSSDGGVISGPLPEVDTDEPQTPDEQVAQRVLPSVVQLRVEGGALSRGQLGEGSGMVVSGDGLVLTNNHVVEPAAGGGTLRAVFRDGRTAPARVVGRDPESDIALVKTDNVAGLTPVELGNSDGVRVGQHVMAIGSPLGLGGTVTSGIVSALNRAVSVGGDEAGAAASSSTVLSALQTDAAINPGNSGGPLVDMQGRVIGINSAIATAGPGGGSIGVGFSIPVNQAKRIADQLRTTGRATHAVLGVEVTDDPAKTGALLRTVAPDGAAARAGLKPGDLVLRLGQQQITTGTELQAAVRSQAPGATVDVQLANRTAQVTLGEK